MYLGINVRRYMYHIFRKDKDWAKCISARKSDIFSEEG